MGLRDTIKTRAQTAPRGQFKGALDVAKQTIQKEGFLALYKGPFSLPHIVQCSESRPREGRNVYQDRRRQALRPPRLNPPPASSYCIAGMMSPLLGIAAVNSLLFTAYMQAKKLVSPYGELSITQIAIAGGIAGGVNAILASPVEMFKIKMQGAFPPPPLSIDALLFL